MPAGNVGQNLVPVDVFGGSSAPPKPIRNFICFPSEIKEIGTALHETRDPMSGSRRALIVIVIVVALLVAVWLVIMTGALAYVLDPDVEGLRAIAYLSSTER